MTDFLRRNGHFLLIIALLAGFVWVMLAANSWEARDRDKHRAVGAAFAERCVAQSNMAVCVDACRTMASYRKEGCEAQILLEVEKGAKP